MKSESAPLAQLTPIISLWQPWAQWVILGWKEIETRLHRRFYSLEGKMIGIHASQKWDQTAVEQARPYLQKWQLEQMKTSFPELGGFLIGQVACTVARPLTAEDSIRALIDCGSIQRHGLVLAYPRRIPAIPMKGKQGIWYAQI